MSLHSRVFVSRGVSFSLAFESAGNNYQHLWPDLENYCRDCTRSQPSPVSFYSKLRLKSAGYFEAVLGKMLTAKVRCFRGFPFRTRSLYLPFPLLAKCRIFRELIEAYTRPWSVRASTSNASIHHFFCLSLVDYSELVYLRAVRSCSVPWMSSRYSPPTFDRNRKTNSGSGCRPFWTAFFTHKMTAKNYEKKSTSSTLSMESKYELIKKYFYCMIPSL